MIARVRRWIDGLLSPDATEGEAAEEKRLLTLIDSPAIWAVAGFAIGAGLGVTTLSVWLLAIGLGAFVAYLVLHGRPRPDTEGRLFAGGPTFTMAWVVGFVVHGLAF